MWYLTGLSPVAACISRSGAKARRRAGAQFATGLAALARQLEGLGLAGPTVLDPCSSAATQLMAMYEQMGNALARQARARHGLPPPHLLTPC